MCPQTNGVVPGILHSRAARAVHGAGVAMVAAGRTRICGDVTSITWGHARGPLEVVPYRRPSWDLPSHPTLRSEGSVVLFSLGGRGSRPPLRGLPPRVWAKHEDQCQRHAARRVAPPPRRHVAVRPPFHPSRPAPRPTASTFPSAPDASASKPPPANTSGAPGPGGWGSRTCSAPGRSTRSWPPCFSRSPRRQGYES